MIIAVNHACLIRSPLAIVAAQINPAEGKSAAGGLEFD